MDDIRGLLETVMAQGFAVGRLRGIFHIAIGRRVTAADGTVLSTGVTWRQLASELKAAKFDKHLIREVGLDPDTVAPRDRERMWYSAIGAAAVNSPAAVAQADQLAVLLKPFGYVIGPHPTGETNVPPSPPPPPPPEPAKKRKK